MCQRPVEHSACTSRFDLMSAPAFAQTPVPPYYAVIFTSLRTEGDQGYGDMAERMVELAHEQPGFLGVESARGAGGHSLGQRR